MIDKIKSIFEFFTEDFYLNIYILLIVIFYIGRYHFLSGIFLIVLIIFILQIKYFKKNEFIKLWVILFLVVNIIFVFYYNTHYDKTSLGEKEGLGNYNYEMLCEVYLLKYNIPTMYQYHTPTSNLFLPTLGIRYKSMYKEERGHVVIYEKRSYLNIYVGEGKVLCKSEGDLETLE